MTEIARSPQMGVEKKLTGYYIGNYRVSILASMHYSVICGVRTRKVMVVVETDIVEPGGEPDHAKRRQLLDAAAAEFIASGYSATTVESIARRAGISKKTIYKIVESKQVLFDSVIKDRFFALPINIDDFGGPQEEALVGLLTTMAQLLLQPERLALLRLIVADAHLSPELSDAFGRIEVDRDTHVLERWLEREMNAGRLFLRDCQRDSKFLFGMTLAHSLLTGLTGDRRVHCPVTLDDQVRRGVRLFLAEMRQQPV